MIQLNEEDIRLKLLVGLPIEIKGIGHLHLPSLYEIISMNESTYNTNISYLLFSKDNLNENPEEFDPYSDYEILISFLYQDSSFRELIFNALEMVFGEKPNYKEGIVYFGELSEDSVLTEEKWEIIKKVIMIGNFIEVKKVEEYKAGNERARKFIEKLKKQKAEAVKIKPKQSLHSIISSIGWKSIGIDNVFNLTIYQLYNGLRTLDNIDNYHYTLTGIYTGNIDGKKIKMSEIHWANIIK
ncbi:hypothetical protein [Metabacillus arenae]|uniref:Uncharacterized protein n=1 Tax=Metabacillus arenae TaxID=2771434 RepID=A0A926NE76_9BACI|nr:hypothetical protein [Metabacillus arenae]MBD1379215.1 hypothetical protein [Metabacillus arenae]